MRNFVIHVIVMFSFIIGFVQVSNGQTTKGVGGVITNSVSTVYGDSKAAIDSLYHDGKTVVGTVYHDAKDGFTNLYPDIKKALKSIGGAIGVAAEHVYNILVKKYVVIGAKQLLFCILGIIVFILGIRSWKRNTPLGKPITYHTILPLVLIVGGIITVLNINYDDMLMGLINPEYGAINYILEYAKNII